MPKISADARPDGPNPPNDADVSTWKAKESKPKLADLVGVKEPRKVIVKAPKIVSIVPAE